jgi:hypothetical protein
MSIQNRVTPGTPDGGQFAGKTHSDDRITLVPGKRPTSRINRLPLQNFTRSVEHATRAERRFRWDMNPPYQRGSVWDIQRRQNLIKSLLLGLPIGTIILNDRGYQKSGPDTAVIDGKQRVEALWAFVDSEFAIPAAWLDDEYVVETEDIEFEGAIIHGVRYSGASAIFQRHFENTPLPMIEASVRGLEAEAEIFVLINAGGVAQTDATMNQARELEAPDVTDYRV